MTEQLYRWVKASERLPQDFTKGYHISFVTKDSNNGCKAVGQFAYVNGNLLVRYHSGTSGEWFDMSEIEWLEPIPSPGDNPDDFTAFMTNSRDAFVKEINEQEWNTKLRTTAEDFLICFDQMRGSIVKGGEEKQVTGYLNKLSAELKERIDVQARNQNLADALRAYVKAQGKMLHDWAEGDESVKKTLWKNLHACEDFAREVLEGNPSRPSIDIVDELRNACPYEGGMGWEQRYVANWNDCCDKLQELLNHYT